MPWTHESITRDVNKVLEQLCNGHLPRNQTEGTAVAIALARSLAKYRGRGINMYAAPHSPKTAKILKRAGVRYEAVEWLVDCVVAQERGSTLARPVLACETEMYASHSVDYDLQRKGGFPTCGYVWDFCKLLHVKAPQLLFVARVNEGRGTRDRMSRLERTLKKCLKEYSRVVGADANVAIVLLPSATRQRERCRIGVSSWDKQGHYGLEFRSAALRPL